MTREPVVLTAAPPAADDPAVATILEGLCRASGATGCVLSLELLPEGETATYRHGVPCEGRSLRIELEAGQRLRGWCELCGAGRGPAASPAAMEALRPLLEGALLALVERSSSARQLEVLAEVLLASDDATLLIDGSGHLVYANRRGDEVLSLHTQQPLARLGSRSKPAPLLHLIAAEIEALRGNGERSRRRTVVLGQAGAPWELQIVALSGPANHGFTLVLLAPSRLPDAAELLERFADTRISPREADVVALLVQGKKAGEIAAALGISEYTVKDHLKHAYAKLGINSRAQLLTRLAAG